MLMIITAELVVAVVMVVMRRRMGMNSVIRTDKLGESREEAKKFLEEVEAMEREAHQVVVVVIGITIIRGTTHTHTHTHTHTPPLNKFSSSPLQYGCRCPTDV